MRHRSLSIAIATLVLAAASPIAAEVPAAKPGRYTMNPTPGGFLRLDTQTGSVSFCADKAGKWDCSGVQDDSMALRKRVEQLEARNGELESEVKRLDELVGVRGSKHGLPKLQIPSEEDIDKGLDYMGRMFRKFRDKLKELENSEGSGKRI